VVVGDRMPTAVVPVEKVEPVERAGRVALTAKVGRNVRPRNRIMGQETAAGRFVPAGVLSHSRCRLATPATKSLPEPASLRSRS